MSRDGSAWKKNLWRLIGTILVVQGLFWTALIGIGETPREHAFVRSYEIQSVYVRPLRDLTPDFSPLDPASRQSFPFLPDSCYHGYKSPAYQFTFNVTASAGGDQALYMPWISDNFETYLNGRLVATPRGTFSQTPSREERRPYLVGIPRSALQAGDNRMDLVVTRTGCTPYIQTAYFGPLKPFRAYEKHMLLLGHYVPIITAITGALVALMALCVLPISGYSPQFVSLAAFMGALSLRALTFVWAGNGLDYTTFLTAIYMVHYLSLFAAAFFVQTWTGQPKRHLIWAGGLFLVFCGGLLMPPITCRWY
ncbi:MAG: hypothetical protein WBQ60_11405 [Asticcacaulis sp.]